MITIGIIDNDLQARNEVRRLLKASNNDEVASI